MFSRKQSFEDYKRSISQKPISGPITINEAEYDEIKREILERRALAMEKATDRKSFFWFKVFQIISLVFATITYYMKDMYPHLLKDVAFFMICAAVAGLLAEFFVSAHKKLIVKKEYEVQMNILKMALKSGFLDPSEFKFLFYEEYENMRYLAADLYKKLTGKTTLA
jgi:hypothetical protein